MSQWLSSLIAARSGTFLLADRVCDSPCVFLSRLLGGRFAKGPDGTRGFSLLWRPKALAALRKSRTADRSPQVQVPPQGNARSNDDADGAAEDALQPSAELLPADQVNGTRT